MTIKQSFFRLWNNIKTGNLHDLTHAYVELWVRIAEAFFPAGKKKKKIPELIAEAARMPDSAHEKGKTMGYYVGHVMAILFPILVILFFVTA